MAPEKTKDLSKTSFDREFEKHREVSRAGAEKKFGGHGLLMDTGELKAGNKEEIKKVIRLHTATHLLYWAIRRILGQDVKQMGSDINPERARFDFSASRKLTPEEVKKMEEMMNEKVHADLPVYFKEMPKTEAGKTGAVQNFKQKYPDMVKVYFIGSESSGGI
ncbi:MAG: alanine--tRNA ligase, partial [Candidatus Wolfebacteria bacterium]|nr:alanine--tRNA ligase [Candidatus Wolfebacteria bacterium]